ncbi:MAG TPA: LuxR C-terminal-related transcriptional regulator [Gaiellaceae bacterium]|nr:LuxR C-terminal-related transcriptional regulator [Gaiellaceae bacterium]
MAAGDLERGRDSYARGAWKDAHDRLSSADQSSPLGVEDIELLATSAYMLGRDHEYVSVLERAYHAYLESGDYGRAVRCAVWCGLVLITRGELGPGGGWVGRAQRLSDRVQDDMVARGYLLMPLVFRHEAAGDLEAAVAVAAEAQAMAEQAGHADGFALASFTLGQILIKAGRVREGLAALDEAMLAVTAGELSPIATGIVYCGVILACQEVFEVRRAKEWTAALTRWAEGQPDLVAFTGRCLVHRAEILQLNGAWQDALDEARQARRRFIESENVGRIGLAVYREAEVQRLLGRLDSAEELYREASQLGWDPQPGLAQLRLAQGRVDIAASTIRRALDEAADPLRRAVLLPAYVEISLASGDVDAAAAACAELEDLAGGFESEMLGAMIAYARGAVGLAQADPQSALPALRRAGDVWRGLEAPYEVARARELVGLACRALGDDDAATLELEAAHAAFERLGAEPDRRRAEGRLAPPARPAGLTPREVEVLRLVAVGRSNREISAELVISEHTVARHLQNIFAKLDVSSRTAAASFAFEHELV